MSFLANKRKPTHLDYCQKFFDLYDYFILEMRKVPKRRINTIALPIVKCLNNAHKSITTLANYYSVKDKLSFEDRYNLTLSAINSILSLQCSLYTYWNIPKDEKVRKFINSDGKQITIDCIMIKENKRKQMVSLLNEELLLLYGVLHNNALATNKNMVEMKFLKAYTNDYIDNAEFLKAIRRLHRYCHTKILKLNRLFRDADGGLILHYINNAWYYAIEGNIFVETKQQYYKRKKYLSIALTNLTNINKPLLSIISLNNLSEKDSEKWISMLNDAIKLLKSVQTSDNKRYKEFK